MKKVSNSRFPAELFPIALALAGGALIGFGVWYGWSPPINELLPHSFLEYRLGRSRFIASYGSIVLGGIISVLGVGLLILQVGIIFLAAIKKFKKLISVNRGEP